jgi:alpha-glucosidase
MRWRERLPVLLHGKLQFVDAPEGVLAFTRTDGAERLFIAFNLTDATVEFAAMAGAVAVSGHGLPEGKLRDGRCHLPAHSVVYARLAT